jgi:hypothetical protein
MRYRRTIMFGAVSFFLLAAAVITAMVVTSPAVVAVRVQDSTMVRHSMLIRAMEIATSRGVDSAFVSRLVTDPSTTFNDELVKINVTNFATKPNYAHNYDAASVRRVRAFLVEHDSLLSLCERMYDVPKEVVASIIWIETKYGKVLGRYHLPSVYLSVILANEPQYVQRNVDVVMTAQAADSSQSDSIRSIIASKAARKVSWAIEQLKAMHALDSVTSRPCAAHGPVRSGCRSSCHRPIGSGRATAMATARPTCSRWPMPHIVWPTIYGPTDGQAPCRGNARPSIITTTATRTSTPC